MGHPVHFRDPYSPCAFKVTQSSLMTLKKHVDTNECIGMLLRYNDDDLKGVIGDTEIQT